jgi:Flp pilus assembly protein TadD
MATIRNTSKPMDTTTQRSGQSKRAPAAVGARLAAALGVAAVGLLLACNTFQGARLYRDGTRALDRGDAPAAIAALERAAELGPEASEIQNHLGLAYQAAGRDDDALRAFQRAVELDCDNAAAAHNLRWAERRREQR